MNTDYLIVRHCRPGDATEHMKALSEPNSNIGNFLGWGVAASNWTFLDHAKWLYWHSQHQDRFDSFSVMYGSKLVAFFSFCKAMDPWGVQICYWVRPSFQGKGIASIVLDTLVTRAFVLDGFEYVELHIDEANIASRRLPEKLGFDVIANYECVPTGLIETGKYLVWTKVNPIIERLNSRIQSDPVDTAWLAPAWSKTALALQLVAILYK